MFRTSLSFLAAALTAYVFGAIFVSQSNIASVIELGFDVTVAQRLDAALHDVTHMTGIYLPLVTGAMLLGLPVARSITRNRHYLRTTGYVLAGFVAIVALHVIMKAVLGLSGVAATRSIFGLLAQGLAGAAGGYLFCRLTAKKNGAPPRPAKAKTQ